MRIHNAKKWTIILCGIPIRGGWADGEVLSWDPVGESYTDVMGTDSEGTRADTGEVRWTITLNLIQGGDVNAELQALHDAGKLAGNGADVTPSLIRNQLGTYEFASPESYIMTPAGNKLDRAPQNRTWIFRAWNPIIVGA